MTRLMQALYFTEFGTSDVLQYGEVPLPQVLANEVLVKNKYIGLNFADIYRRRGTYQIEKHYPYIDGYEGAGSIVQVGSAVDPQLLGQNILYVDVPLANAEYVAVPETKVITLPEDISPKLAATIGLQGLTADFLAHDLGSDQAPAQVFITGISGGVGQLLAQILLADGFQVFGSASTAAKRSVALKMGVQEVFPSRELSWLPQQSGKFQTVYDGVGANLDKSLQLLQHRGRVVFFGMAGGNPPQIDLVQMLAESKSILTGDLWDYLTSFAERKRRSERLFSYLRQGKIQITEPKIFALSAGKAAHQYLESGKNIGKVLLQP